MYLQILNSKFYGNPPVLLSELWMAKEISMHEVFLLIKRTCDDKMRPALFDPHPDMMKY